jgi:hypothetical protein
MKAFRSSVSILFIPVWIACAPLGQDHENQLQSQMDQGVGVPSNGTGGEGTALSQDGPAVPMPVLPGSDRSTLGLPGNEGGLHPGTGKLTSNAGDDASPAKYRNAGFVQDIGQQPTCQIGAGLGRAININAVPIVFASDCIASSLKLLGVTTQAVIGPKLKYFPTEGHSLLTIASPNLSLPNVADAVRDGAILPCSCDTPAGPLLGGVAIRHY